jgi:hypothetical protein
MSVVIPERNVIRDLASEAAALNLPPLPPEIASSPLFLGEEQQLHIVGTRKIPISNKEQALVISRNPSVYEIYDDVEKSDFAILYGLGGTATRWFQLLYVVEAEPSGVKFEETPYLFPLEKRSDFDISSKT